MGQSTWGVPLAESENPEPKLPLTMAPIPEPFCWDESFAVFYEQLDAEHKGLFDGIFAVAAAPGDAGKLDALKGKVAAHFTYEESQFSASGGYAILRIIRRSMLSSLPRLGLLLLQ